MNRNIGVAIALLAIGFALGVGLKLLAVILIAIALGLAIAFLYALVRGGTLGEDDIEEVFPDRPARAPEAQHEWRNTSAKAPHAD